MGSDNKFIKSETKASSDSELIAVLDLAQALRHPFHIPTMVLSREAYEGLDFNAACAQLSRDISAYKERPRVMDVRDIDNLARSSAQALRQPHFAKNSFFRAENGFAHERGAGNFKEYFFSVVMPMDAEMTGGRYLNALLSGDSHNNNLVRASDVLRDDKQKLQLHSLLHEYSHSAGAGEPQAEKMASIAFRQVTTPEIARPYLAYTADMRAVNNVFKSDVPEIQQLYGWAMVRVLDDVTAMSEEAIDAMSKYDVRALRYEVHALESQSLRSVGEKVFGDKRDYRKEDGSLDPAFLKICREKTQELLAKEAFPVGSTEQEIAQRLALAAQRLDAEDDAYSDYAQVQP